MSTLLIGTSGWSYKGWSSFYPDDIPKRDYLKYYTGRFNSVEVNATYYNLPSENAVDNWREVVPGNFHFSVKGHRRITHYNKMKEIDEPLRQYLSRVRRLGDVLKTVVWQFPPNFKKNAERLEKFL
jgi:uncharacterized protein YecE (DUF72 family)